MTDIWLSTKEENLRYTNSTKYSLTKLLINKCYGTFLQVKNLEKIETSGQEILV
jgi:hypothetical protein